MGSPKLEPSHAAKNRYKKSHCSKKSSKTPKMFSSSESGSSSDDNKVRASKKVRKKFRKTDLKLIESSDSSSVISEDSSSDSSEDLLIYSTTRSGYCRKQKDFVLPVKFDNDDCYSLRSYLKVLYVETINVTFVDNVAFLFWVVLIHVDMVN